MSKDYILHIASWYPHTEDTYEGDFVERHIQCISEHIPGVVYFSKPVLKPSKEIQIQETKQVKVYRRLFKRANPFSNYIKYHALSKPDLEKIISNHGVPLIIHCHIGFRGISIAHYLADRFSVPLVMTEQSTIYQQEKINSKERLIIKYLQKYIPKVDVICPVSHAHLIAIKQKCKIKSAQVVSNVIQDNFFETLLKKSKTPSKLLHVSSFDDDQKNITDILKGFVLAKSQNPKITLTLAGSTNHEKVKRLIRKLKVNKEGINIIGPILYKDIPLLMTDHDLMVLWSRHETFSLVVAEAWASGLPVITNNCGGITAEVTDTLGHKVEEYTPEGLANSILLTLKDYSRFDLVAIREHAQSKYSTKLVGKAFIDIYSSLQS